MPGSQECQSDANAVIDELTETYTNDMKAMVTAVEAQTAKNAEGEVFWNSFFATSEQTLNVSVAEQTTLNAQIEEARLALEATQTAVSIAMDDKANARAEIRTLYEELNVIAKMKQRDQEDANAVKLALEELGTKLDARMQEAELVEARKLEANVQLGLLGTRLTAAAMQLKKTQVTTDAVSALLARHKKEYEEAMPNVDDLTLAMQKMRSDWAAKQEALKMALEQEFKDACAAPVNCSANKEHAGDSTLQSATLNPAWQRRMQGWTFSSLRSPTQ